MSYVTQSTKRNRVYHRTFDHDEARRLRAQGMPYSQIADRVGTSVASVQRACDPKRRARMDEQTRLWSRRQRTPCKGGCGRRVWPSSKTRTGYCMECVPLPVDADVRPGELRCTACREWKPDREFPTHKGVKRRRNHSSECRKCSTDRRRDFRRRHPELEKAAGRRRTDRKREANMATTYVVLEPNGDEGGYREVARGVAAGSPAHAIEQAAKEPGEYVAIPEGRFKLMKVKPVQALRVIADE